MHNRGIQPVPFGATAPHGRQMLDVSQSNESKYWSGRSLVYSGLSSLMHFISALRNANRQRCEGVQSFCEATKPIRYPSFKGRIPASLLSSRTKKSNTRSDTKHEVRLRSELHRMGLRFRKNVSSLPGNPDIVFGKAGLVVFCDGDFWHGRDWAVMRRKLAHNSNASYWLAKIAANRERDRLVTRTLTRLGWKVVRVWEKDILQDVNSIAREVAALVSNRLLSVNENSKDDEKPSVRRKDFE